MKIAVDKNSLNVRKRNDAEYIYLFDGELLEELLKTNLHCLDYRYCSYVDINLTNYNIDCLKKAKPTDKNFDVLPPKKDYKIGIMIPNYNYENLLKKSINSVLNQTYTNYEIVFVDDVSTDGSVKLAKKLLKSPHKVVKLKQKRYNGGARNEAYLHFSEDVDYVFNLDSDDWLLDNTALEDINNKLQNYPDVLFLGLSEYKNGVVQVNDIPDYKDRYDAIAGWSGCGKVIKKSLATRQECLYNEGTLKEDKNQHCKICIYMQDFNILERPVYVWNRDNMKSVTHLRDNIFWKTSTIRHYADAMELYLNVKGEDKRIDDFLEYRLNLCENEIKTGGDRQW